VGQPALNDDRTRRAVEAYLAALNSHDADAIAACVAAGFVNEHTSASARSLTGRGAYRTALDNFLAEFTGLRYVAERFIVEGSSAAVSYRMSFRKRSAGGRDVSVRGVFLFTVDSDGLISHRTDYWDSGQVTRQLS
jgi:steroid delta-isomerase-like uncharacterized protein